MGLSVGELDKQISMGMGSQSVRKLTLLLALAMATVGLATLPVAPAQAVGGWYVNASTGGTYIKALGGTVSSDLTAASAVSGLASTTSKNSTANVAVAGLANIGAIETRTSSEVASGAVTLTSWARVAGVNLLNGLVKIDAVETTITTKGTPEGASSWSANHQFLGIKILGLELPVDLPDNFAASIPGVATVSLNYAANSKGTDTTNTIGWALAIQLLKPRDGFNAGTTIILNPVSQAMLYANPDVAATVGGHAYGTRVQANVGDQVKVVSDPTARIVTPVATSGGNELRNTTATINLPGLLTTGAVTSTSTSAKTGKDATVVNSNKTVGLNLLNGLIKADVIEVTASGKRVNGVWTGQLKMTTVNLVVAGQTIPLNVGPNTRIDVLGLGEVVVNRQVQSTTNRQNLIQALYIKLDTARAGLPVGAVIEVGVAATVIY